MDEEVDPNVIKATQISLGKYVKRPPLSEKLLRKPPFRFLHDIVTSVLKSKGFFDGLFEDNELISDNVKDRESKIIFLNKVISVLSLTTGQPLSAKPSKIVAGQESVKTNELLQCLAQALDKNLSSDEAVKRFKTGVKELSSTDKKIEKKTKDPVKSVKKNSDPKKLTSKSTEKLITSDKDGKIIKSRNKESNQYNKKESPPKKIVSKSSDKHFNKKLPGKQDQEILVHTSDSIKEKDSIPLTQTILDSVTADDPEKKSLEYKNSDTHSNKKTDLQEDLTCVENKKDTTEISENEANITKPTSAGPSIPIDNQSDEVVTEINQENDVNKHLLNNKHVEKVKAIFEENKTVYESEVALVSTDLRLNSEQTLTPLNKNDKIYKMEAVIRPASVRPSSSRPGAPRHREKNDIIDPENVIVGKVNIISENALQEEEEDIIIIDSQMVKGHDEVQDNHDQNDLMNNQNSHLVQQILDSHKEYSQTSGKTEIEWQVNAQKAPDVFIQEMDQLRFSVQAISRIANPLGKLLDHIQEDVEVMRQELHQWEKIYEETAKDLTKQKAINEDSLQAYYAKLKQLNVDIEEKREKITDLKVSNHKNASKIEKLLANGNVQ